jgi:hypothetical protein
MYKIAHILCPWLCPLCWIWKEKLHTNHAFKISIWIPNYISNAINKTFVHLKQSCYTPSQQKRNTRLRFSSRCQYVGKNSRSIDGRLAITVPHGRRRDYDKHIRGQRGRWDRHYCSVEQWKMWLKNLTTHRCRNTYKLLKIQGILKQCQCIKRQGWLTLQFNS